MTEIQQKVRLTLSGCITFQQDISVALGAEVISMLQAHSDGDNTRVSPEPLALPPPATPTREAGRTRTQGQNDSPGQSAVESPRQALELSGAKTIPEKMTAFAAYLLQKEGRDAFTQSDLRRLFQRARERIPTHFSREFDAAVRAGWIHEGEAKGEHYVSEAARNVLTEGFGDLRAKRGSKSSGTKSSRGGPRRRKGRIASTPEVFAGLDDIPSAINGVVPYHRVPLKRDKLLWVLKIAKDAGIQDLQNGEAEWLSDKLGEVIPSRDMKSHMTGLQRRDLANRSTDNSMRITAAGEEYLQAL